MDKKFEKIGLLGLLLSVAASAFAADSVRDEFITTTDRTCGIHYLTDGNTVGWYLTEVSGSCPGGVLDGRGSVAVRNAFGKPVRNLSGFFTQGYWTGKIPQKVPLKTLLLSDSDTQTLLFELGGEERLDLHYLGRMTATRSSDGGYGPFSACRPVWILAVTPHTDIFEDEAVQQELINSVLNQARDLCPEADQIYFYGSDTEDPTNKDIAFFADIRLSTGQIKVRRLPSSPRVRDILTRPAEAADIPVPKEIRQETGLPVVEITPVRPEQPTAEKPAPTPKPVAIPVLPPTPPAEPTPVTPEITPTPEVTQAEPEEAPIPEAAPAPIPDTWDDIPALLTASRLLKQPVDGKTLIHISHFDETGAALTDEPAVLRLKGNSLSLGWGIAEGAFSHTATQGPTDSVGFVQVRSFTPVSKVKER